MTGAIFDIQRFSIHDGPGIRTTVFFKGCPLNCAWCHNPEGISRAHLLSFRPALCIGCGYCFRTCPLQCHRMEDGKHFLERARCEACGRCAAECYAGALELVGREASVEGIMREVLRDKAFYDNSGGGLTLSGGEPLMQPDFAFALLGAAKDAGLHCCVETSGCAARASFDLVRPKVDLFLYDIKETDSARHVEFTGRPNDQILANLRHLHGEGANIILRLPMIPGYNDRPDHFDGIAALARDLPGLKGVEIMPYHQLGENKVERFAMNQSARAKAAAPEPGIVDDWVRELRRRGVNVLTA